MTTNQSFESITRWYQTNCLVDRNDEAISKDKISSELEAIAYAIKNRYPVIVPTPKMWYFKGKNISNKQLEQLLEEGKYKYEKKRRDPILINYEKIEN